MQVLKKQAQQDEYLKQQYHYLTKLVSGEIFAVQEKLNNRIEKDVVLKKEYLAYLNIIIIYTL